jgi:hypothetical protein
MPRSTTGKWVARAAATGGGRTYRGRRPVNWYAGLVVIVVIGLASVVFARYEYQHPKKSVSVQPTVGQHWYAAISFDQCGTNLPSLPATSDAQTLGVTTLGDGVINIQPQTNAQAGVHATLGQFQDNTPDMVLSATAFEYPGNKLLTNGTKCPSGSPDAGKAGQVEVSYWANTDTKTQAVTVTDPKTLKLGFNSLVTVGFVPKGTVLKRPAQTIITSLLLAGANGASPTTTTAPATTTTTTGSTTSTTAASSTSTTAKSSTTSTTTP